MLHFQYVGLMVEHCFVSFSIRWFDGGALFRFIWWGIVSFHFQYVGLMVGHCFVSFSIRWFDGGALFCCIFNTLV